MGGAWALSLPFLERGGPVVEGGGWGFLCGRGAGAVGAGTGADTRCDRSRMDAWRSAIPGAVCCSWVWGRFASWEEMSWSSSLRFSFSPEMVATAWVTPLSSYETVTRPWTSWERRTIVIDSIGRVPACASGLGSGKSRLLSLRALLAWASCLIMNSMG